MQQLNLRFRHIYYNEELYGNQDNFYDHNQAPEKYVIVFIYVHF